MLYLDTNVLLYAVNQGDPIKNHKARDILKAGGYISTQGVNEFCHVCLGKFKILPTDVYLLVNHLGSILTVLQPDISTTQEAIGLYRRYGYSYYDSLQLAMALQKQIPVFYTEDLHSGQRIESSFGFILQIENPF